MPLFHRAASTRVADVTFLPLPLLGAALALAGVSPAKASVIDYNDLKVGNHSIQVGDLVVTANSGNGNKASDGAFEAFTSSANTVKIGVGVGAPEARAGTIDANEFIDVTRLNGSHP